MKLSPKQIRLLRESFILPLPSFRIEPRAVDVTTRQPSTSDRLAYVRDPFIVDIEKRFRKFVADEVMCTGGYDYVLDKQEELLRRGSSDLNESLKFHDEYLKEHTPAGIDEFLQSLVIAAFFDVKNQASILEFTVSGNSKRYTDRFMVDNMVMSYLRVSIETFMEEIMQQVMVFLIALFESILDQTTCVPAWVWYNSKLYFSTDDFILADVRVYIPEDKPHFVATLPEELCGLR